MISRSSSAPYRPGAGSDCRKTMPAGFPDHAGAGSPGAGDVAKQMTLTLPAAGQAAWVARQVTRETLAAWRVAHLEETAVLLISELVTNAVRHARPGRLAMALYLDAGGAWLRIEVHDADPHEPRQS